MYDNEYFVVDMAACASTGEIINNLSIALEALNHTGKKIVLKLNNNYLNQSQLLSIQSLVTSCGCTLDTIETLNPKTWAIAENMNIYVQKPIEKRVEDKPELSTDSVANIGLDTLYSNSLAQSKVEDTNSIPIKESNGLHFEADLDAIQQQQDNISKEIETSKYSRDIDLKEAIAPEEEKEIKLDKLSIIEPPHKIENKTIDFITDNKSKTSDEAFEEAQDDDIEGNKNSIGVYKKAYDSDLSGKKEWEDVDFYESPTNEPVVKDTKTTTYINQTLRSGQILEAEGNVVVIGDCHPGSEIRAVGDITVWGVLSGIAHAGYKGNEEAKVRALKLNAIQLRIASCYSRRPDDTNIPYIIRSSVFTPEEARIVDGEIVLFKMNQN